MGEILDLAEALWKEEVNTYTYHPIGPPFGIEPIAEGTWFHKGFSNTIIRETDDGLIIIDPSGARDQQAKFDAVRSVVQDRLHTAVYTHGHLDHIFGVQQYVDEAVSKDWPRPQVIAHEDALPRFKRYRETAGYNGTINSRQFWGGKIQFDFPVDFHHPDITFRDQLTINVDGASVFLKHARGETDDHIWAFFRDTRVLCPGDLIFWCIPNAGNPQKVQRYCKDWAVALREMAALEPEIMAPGHGWPVMGASRVRQVLDDTASLLESLHEQTLDLMNKGASLDEVLHTVKAPPELLKQPYLQPVYDEPEFIVRNIWRLYGGWYDGTPSHLKPAPEQSQAEEIARLAGGADKLAARAKELTTVGDLRLACHLADWAHLAAPEDGKIKDIASEVYAARAKAESSTMAIGIYLSTAIKMGGEPEEVMPKGNVIQTQSEWGKREFID